MQSVLSLTKEERRALVSLTRSRVSPAADVKRARLMIMLDDGLSWKSISKQLPCSPDYINRWRRRLMRIGLAGSMLGIGAVHRQRTRRSSKRGFWPGLRTDLTTARRTGRVVSWVRRSAYRI